MVRGWSLVHRWSSLICTLFLLMLCLTGLPLIFSAEIDRAFDRTAYDPPQAGRAAPSLDRLIAMGRRLHPGQEVISLYADDDAPVITLRMAPSLKAWHERPALEHLLQFDAHSGRLLREGSRSELARRSPTAVLLALHRSLFAGLPGELFLGVMGLLFVVAVVSGVVLYGPFTRKLPFGTLRRHRGARRRWLDRHNLLGIVTTCWALAVGGTGIMNELAVPLFAAWQQSEMQAVLKPYAGMPVPGQDHLVSAQGAVDTAMAALPDTHMLSIAFPDARDGSPWHDIVWLKGSTALTSRLFHPVLVDARTGRLTGIVPMPWSLRALEVSRPLHFGDYGGLPLKILWALLDGVTIIVLGSGLFLWIIKGFRVHRPGASAEAASRPISPEARS
ncbi:PepSY-associated TM helix domain-containing protein [Novosphingobium terrae]|uniref:PepSY-associated TM helix domain-containing protein n=1 Tax=Novosphingobium terrae TaxID=2726189 RepID=UPI00197FB493|nr:PepSY-associated TM helix domain-containing protein [Novosphingobium terrae]